MYRFPKSKPEQLIDKIEDEYHNFGKWMDTGTVSKRNLGDQARITRTLLNSQVKVPKVVSTNHQYQITEYIPSSETVDSFMENASFLESRTVAIQILRSLQDAHHKANVIIGDRWSHNFLISKKNNRLATHNIDFDLELGGPMAQQLEIGQAIYYLLVAGKHSILDILAVSLADSQWNGNLDFVEKVLRGHAEYFSKSNFADKHDLVEVLVRFTRILKTNGDLRGIFCTLLSNREKGEDVVVADWTKALMKSSLEDEFESTLSLSTNSTSTNGKRK